MTAIMQDSKRRLPVRQTVESGTFLLGITAEYALRAMAHIAGAPRDQPATASELAAATFVPVHYLSKLLRKLVTAGLLVSQKGHRGGFVLVRSVQQIRFIDVLEAVDRALRPTTFLDLGFCRLAGRLRR